MSEIQVCEGWWKTRNGWVVQIVEQKPDCFFLWRDSSGHSWTNDGRHSASCNMHGYDLVERVYPTWHTTPPVELPDEFREGDQIVVPGVGTYTRGAMQWRTSVLTASGCDDVARKLLTEPVTYIPAPKPEPTPLTLMQAIEAAKEGKTVRCDAPGLESGRAVWDCGLIWVKSGNAVPLVTVTLDSNWFIAEDGQ